MKHIFVVNKISGKGSALSTVDTIKDICERKGLDYVIEITQYAGATKDILAKYNDLDEACVYSVGGDGTFLEVVNYVDPRFAVGVIPGGSGNDFYRQYGGKNRDFAQIINDTIDAEPIVIDIGQSDLMKFANTNSIGIDGQMSYDAVQMIRKTFLNQNQAYFLSIFINAIKLGGVNVRMTIDGKDYSGKYYVVNVMNGRYYGNGVLCAPDGSSQDGLFDVIIFHRSNRFKTYKALLRYLKGKATEEDGCQIVKGKDIIIDSLEGEFVVQTDGENYKASHLESHILEGYLKLKVAK